LPIAIGHYIGHYWLPLLLRRLLLYTIAIFMPLPHCYWPLRFAYCRHWYFLHCDYWYDHYFHMLVIDNSHIALRCIIFTADLDIAIFAPLLRHCTILLFFAITADATPLSLAVLATLLIINIDTFDFELSHTAISGQPLSLLATW